MFESVNTPTHARTDGRTPARPVYFKLTSEPSAQVSLKYDLWSCQKVTDALIFLLDNIFIRFGSKLYRQNVGIPIGTNCAPPLLLTYFCSAMSGTS